MINQLVLYETANGIATITLNRPKVLNAFNQDLLTEIIRKIADAQKDPKIQVIILTGEGKKAFSTGVDITMLQRINSVKARELSLEGEKLCTSLMASKKITIAAINGYALGGGLEVAMSCDIRIAADNARFGLPEIAIGLFPGWGGTQRLPRLIGEARAKELIFTGDIIDSTTAKKLGIVNTVVPANKFREAVQEFAMKIATQAPIALTLAKEVINKGMNTDIYSGISLEREGFCVVASTKDAQEGIKAFIEKRKAKFKGI